MPIVSARSNLSFLVSWLVVVSLTVLVLGCDFRPAQSVNDGHDGGLPGAAGAGPTSGSGGATAATGGSGSLSGGLGGSAMTGGRSGSAGSSGQAGMAGKSGCPAQCPTGQVCLGGSCQADPCLAASAMACATGTTCHASCVAVTDPCAGVACPSGQTCVGGACIPGCFAEP